MVGKLIVFLYSQFKFLLELFCGAFGPLLEGPCFNYKEGDFHIAMPQVDMWLDGLIARAAEAGVECQAKFKCGPKYVLPSDRKEGLAEEAKKKRKKVQESDFTALFAEDGTCSAIGWCLNFDFFHEFDW